MRLTRRLVSMLFAFALLLNCTTAVFATENNTISFEKFYSQLQNEYEKYGIKFSIENPNLDYVYTQEYLNEKLEDARLMGESIPRPSKEEIERFSEYENQSTINGGGITINAMPIKYSWSDDYTVKAETIPGYCYVQVSCTGTVDVQTGNVITAKASARRKAGLNVKSSRFTAKANRDETMVHVMLDGTVTFSYTEPKTNSTFVYDAYGPFAMFGFTPENCI